MAPRTSATYAFVARTGSTVKGMFNFFGLPRELRDAIYDNLLVGSRTRTRQEHLGATGVQVYVDNGPRLRHLRVSRQFLNELQDRVLRTSYLDLVQFDGFTGSELRMPWKVNVALCVLHLPVLLASPDEKAELVDRICSYGDMINVTRSRDLIFDLNLHFGPLDLFNDCIDIVHDNFGRLLSQQSRTRGFLRSLRIWLDDGPLPGRLVRPPTSKKLLKSWVLFGG